MSNSAKSPIDKVRQFMETFGQPVRFQPVAKLTNEEASLRIRLIAEELEELANALGIGFYYEVNASPVADPVPHQVEALDALTDLRYVVYGAFHTLGLAKAADAAFDEVQMSNMTKGEDCAECDGKGTLYEGPTGPTESEQGRLYDCPKCNGYGVIAKFNEHGKIIKPPTYSKPNLERVMKETFPPRPHPDAILLGGSGGMLIKRDQNDNPDGDKTYTAAP